MDVWLDSGVAWHTLSDDEGPDTYHSKKIADLAIEGVDQFRGWFQSSLLSSMAVRVIQATNCY